MVAGLLLIPFCGYFEQVASYAIYIYFYIFSFAASQLYLCDLRGKELLFAYSIGSIIQTFCIAVFNIVFLIVLKKGIEGYLLAYILANSVVALYAIVIGKSYKSVSFNNVNIEK